LLPIKSAKHRGIIIRQATLPGEPLCTPGWVRRETVTVLSKTVLTITDTRRRRIITETV